MVTFRNNNGRRSNFRRNERNFKSNGDRNKFNNNFSTSENFQRKSPGRNNHNAPKLIEKYNNLAREALSNGDKILSEIRKVINKSSELIKRSGHFIIEIGFDQKNKVKKILRDNGFYIKRTVKDLSNHDRCIVSIKT